MKYMGSCPLNRKRHSLAYRGYIFVSPPTSSEVLLFFLFFYRNFAFLHSRMMLDNGGIFVCRWGHLSFLLYEVSYIMHKVHYP
jgi:hypothetical protein